MVQSCDTWYAVRTEEHVTLQYLRPFGLEYILHGRKSDALVPDRLRVKTGRPVHGRILIHNLNGLLDDVVSGGYSDRRPQYLIGVAQRPLTGYQPYCSGDFA